MTVQSNFSAFSGVPVSRLILAPENVRKDKSEEGIPELSRSIERRGVIQNLIVYEADPPKGWKGAKPLAVVAGGRRWRALQRLLKAGTISKSYIVPVFVTSKEAAVALSLAENADRKTLHPADEFEAARALIDAGQSIEDVAAQLDLSTLTVQRRLRLARVAPEFIQMYRDDKEVSLEHLMSLATTDDHERQRQAWKALSRHARHPTAIRRELTQTEVISSDPLARFVTIKAYEKAGGQIRRDLFIEDVYLTDVDLVTRLATAKLDKHAAKLREEGVPWVDVSPRPDYSEHAAYGAVQMIERALTDKEQAKLAALEQERVEIEAARKDAAGDADEIGRLFDRSQRVKQREYKIELARTIPDPEQVAKAGALVCVDNSGELKVLTGLLKPEDKRLFAAQAKKRAREAGGANERSHSAALLLRFTAHRTQALQAEFAQNPEVALAAVIHRFVINTFDDYQGGAGSPLKIQTDEVRLSQFNEDLESTDAHRWLETQRTRLHALLPGDPKVLFQWILEQPHAEKLALLAFCAASTVDAIQGSEDQSVADPLARALCMDLRKWWTPTAAGYLGCIPKDAVLRAVSQAVSAEGAAKIEKLKKKEVALEAEKLLAGTGWLPEFARSSWAGPTPMSNGAQTA